MKVRIIMRKHCARKWLHFTIDLLPFVVIPIFAIWGINHGDYNKDVEITYKYQTNDVESIDDLVIDNLYHFDSLTLYEDVYSEEDLYFSIYFARLDNIDITSFSDMYYDEVLSSGYSNDRNNVFSCYWFKDVEAFHPSIYTYYTNTDFYANIDYDNVTDVVFTDVDFYFIDSVELSHFKTVLLWGINEYDGVLPTASSYNVIDSVEVNDVGIGEAFYNSIIDTSNKYFNFDNVFNFGELKEWFNVNFFSGSMPPLINVLFNVIFYEFITDIIMLIYTFFMFIIDFANDLLERPFSDIKRG